MLAPAAGAGWVSVRWDATNAEEARRWAPDGPREVEVVHDVHCPGSAAELWAAHLAAHHDAAAAAAGCVNRLIRDYADDAALCVYHTDTGQFDTFCGSEEIVAWVRRCVGRRETELASVVEEADAARGVPGHALRLWSSEGAGAAADTYTFAYRL